jgi:hypothetical protein
MKKYLFLFALLILSNLSFSQSITCQELKEVIEEEAKMEKSVTCFGSSALVKAEYYSYDGEGFVIVYLKSNDYHFRGKPYVYCGISSNRWNKFVSEGGFGSLGKSFVAYIKSYKCNC